MYFTIYNTIRYDIYMKITSLFTLWITFRQLWVPDLAISCSFFVLSNVWLLCSSNFNQDDTQWFDLSLFCARKATCSSSLNWEEGTEWLRSRRQHRRQINSSVQYVWDLICLWENMLMSCEAFCGSWLWASKNTPLRRVHLQFWVL